MIAQNKFDFMDNLSEDSYLYRVIDKVIPGEKTELLHKLGEGKKLRIKFGTDPTGTDLHFGHAVNLRVLRQMQDIGHRVDLIIGDATASIGDPTGRNRERPQLDELTIQGNASKFVEQATRILDPNPDLLTVHRNSVWFKEMDGLSFIHRILRPVTLSRMIERKTFRDRIEAGVPIHGHELVYQLLQGYDSVHLQSDIAVCGDDQLTNENMGRTFQQYNGQSPQIILTTRITPGIDGRAKQSKSLGNYIGLNHSVTEQYRRIMSIPDTLIREYFEVYTELPTSEIISLISQYANDNRNLKKKLAAAMLCSYHPADAIALAEESYERSAAKRSPVDSPVYLIQEEEVDLLGFVKTTFQLSKTHFRNLIKNNAVRVNGRKLALSDIGADGRVIIPVVGDVEIKYGANKWAILRKA